MNSVVRFLDNRMNPLLLRELRQLVRNRFIIVLINLLVAILVFICMMTVLFQDGSQLRGAGAMLFGWLTSMMSIGCFLAVVVYTAMTTANDRINDDLMFTSAMRPSSIVTGKALAGAALTVLLMSITAPFVTLAYLLRGLDIELVAITFLIVFVIVQLMNVGVIWLFSNVRTRVHMSVMMLFGFFAMMFLIGNALSMFFPGRLVGTWESLWHFMLVSASIFAVLFSAAIISLAPQSSNRVLPFRIVLTVLYLGSLAFVLYNPTYAGTNPLTNWAAPWIFIVIALVFLVVNERETWGFRIRQTIPRSWIFRVFCFPFYTGSPNGIIWVALLCAGVAVSLIIPGSTSLSNSEFVLFWFLFAFNYCVTALLLRTWVFSRYISVDKTWAITSFLFVFFLLGGLLISLLFHSPGYGDVLDTYTSGFASALNPFLLTDRSDGTTIRAVAGLVWAAALIPFFLFWFVRRIVRFSPCVMDDAMTLDQAVRAVRDAEANPLVKGEREKRKTEQY